MTLLTSTTGRFTWALWRLKTWRSTAIVTVTELSIEKWRNPFKDAWMTLRGEVLDLKAMMNAMAGRSAQEQLQIKAEQKRNDKK
jgi:hypothetical protein